MKNKIFTVLAIVCSLWSFGQSGEKFNVLQLKPRGAAPTSSTWGDGSMYFNNTQDLFIKKNGVWTLVGGEGIQDGANTTSFFQIATQALNKIEIGENGPIGSTDYIRFSGGEETGDPSILYLTNDYIGLSGISNTDIANADDGAIITKGYANANYGPGAIDWGVLVNDHIIPDTPATYDIGSIAYPFRQIRIEDILLTDGSNNEDWMISSSATVSGRLYFYEKDGTYQGYYSLASGGTPVAPTDLVTKSFADANYIDAGSGNAWSDPVDSSIYPDTDNLYSIGATGNRFNNGWFNSFHASSATIDGNISVGQRIITDYLTIGARASSPAGFLGNFYTDSDDNYPYFHNGADYVRFVLASGTSDDFILADGSTVPVTDFATKAYVDTADINTDGINKTADFTLSDMDIQAGVLNIQTNDSIVVTVPSGLTETGFVKMIVEGTGFVAVEQGAIATLNGDYKSQSGEGETLTLRIKSGTEAVVLDPSDLLAYTPLGNGCPTADPFPTNTNPNMIAGNVLAYCPDELNVLPTGGPGDGEINTIGVTESAIADSLTGYGDYVLRVTADDGTGDYLQINHTLVVGEIYEWHLSYKSVQGSSHQYKFQTGNPDTSTIAFTNTTFNTTSGEFTADNTDFAFRVWPALAGSASDAVDIKFYLKLKND